MLTLFYSWTAAFERQTRVPWTLWLAVLDGCFVISREDIERHDQRLDAAQQGEETSEPDGPDTPEEALEIDDALSNEPLCVPGAIERPGDIDWYRFTGAGPNESVLISAVAASAQPPYATDTVLATEDGLTADGSLYGLRGTDAALSIAAGAAVAVSDADPGAGGGDRRYQICAQSIPSEDREPNDFTINASAVGPFDQEGLILLGGSWDGGPDVYSFPAQDERVYRVSLVAGHAIGEARLSRLSEDGTELQGTDLPDFDDRPSMLGYPTDAGLMFRGSSGPAWLRVDGQPPGGPYVLAIQEVEPFAFPMEIEPNDDSMQARVVPLLQQSDGSYRNEVQGSLSPYDPLDTFLLDPGAQGIDWSTMVLDVVVQAASVGASQDLSLRITDPDSGQEIGTYEDDPSALLSSDPASLGLELEEHARLQLEVVLTGGTSLPGDQWFLTLEAHPQPPAANRGRQSQQRSGCARLQDWLDGYPPVEFQKWPCQPTDEDDQPAQSVRFPEGSLLYGAVNHPVSIAIPAWALRVSSLHSQR